MYEMTGDESWRDKTYLITPVGVVRSALKDRASCPKQGREGAPDAWIDVASAFEPALSGLSVGQEVLVLTWFHQGRRDVLKVHPRDNRNAPLRGVFSTRSPDRPNPIGLHRVEILEIGPRRLRVGPLEALDGTPVIDIKPVLPRTGEG
ncbi:MAG: tRNA (N6-threonylcarbamoyladenosine(37)-N6)-methyltransferase TrmO [Nitrospiraceae bacterium]|nr:tRNA (N6-threonylcarbamoyladenosine(37)-N6)-methyltransferase TrmO [Nitrospiraceae bacterium]